MHPCKKCLVKAICNDEACKDYKKYRNMIYSSAIILGFLIVIISISIQTIICNNHGIGKTVMIVAAFHFVILMLIFMITRFNESSFPLNFMVFSFIFGPYIIMIDILINITKYMTKHPSEKELL
jgi:hypothetical protein